AGPTGSEDPGILIKGIGQLVTNERLMSWLRAPLNGGSHVSPDHLSIVSNAWIWIRDGKVDSYGFGQPPAEIARSSREIVDAEGRLVTPGFLDCHTHAIYGGSRANEFAMRVDGMTYQEIAAKGGGIASTVASSRAASNDSLKTTLLTRLRGFLRYGV